MEIQWINGQYAEDNRIFDMEMEVYEWSDSLYVDFLDCLVNKKNVGYATPDEKVTASLSELLPKWADYLNVKVAVHRDKINVNDIILYRVWTMND
ncbi:MAG: hypothetical protein ABS939_06650 [Psychrobacillus sp.]|uniref:hypothetical protein n=1 Tax=uncultured Psychrobacillus sp. TaxID=1551585 RepID=UPI00262E63B9|nr:hypothetical protein [uncultured Psychrobacillus sp.]